jgi:hypothetical protein
MSNKSLLKFGIAFGLLAVVLVFLGVNFVPRIYASSSAQSNVVVAGKQTRPDYLDESYPHAILDSRNPQAIALQLSFAGTDALLSHLQAIAPQLSFAGTDALLSHLQAIASQVSFTGTDALLSHPSK